VRFRLVDLGVVVEEGVVVGVAVIVSEDAGDVLGAIGCIVDKPIVVVVEDMTTV
jgi:hypothetical protein